MSGKLSTDLEAGGTAPQYAAVGPLQRLGNRNALALFFAALFLAWLLLPSLTCFFSAAYGVAYWVARSPAQWALPLPPEAQQQQLNFTVPKVRGGGRGSVGPGGRAAWRAAPRVVAGRRPEWLQGGARCGQPRGLRLLVT